MGKHWTLSEEAKRNIRNAAIGRRWSEETKQRVRDSWTPEKRAEASKLHSGENNNFFGKTWTPEHRAKIMASWTPERLEKARQAKLGKKVPQGKGNRKGYSPITTPHPKCDFCDKPIKFNNKIGACREHRLLSKVFKEQRKKNHDENKEERNKKVREYIARPEIRAKKQEYDMEYRKRNAKKIDTRVYQWRVERMARDPLFKFKERLKTRIHHAFRAMGMKKPKHSMELLGGTLEEIQRHIESKFTDGMTWGNYGKWHADHFIPLSSGQTKEEMIQLCHYMNLQPLWALDNLRKGKKILSRP